MAGINSTAHADAPDGMNGIANAPATGMTMKPKRNQWVSAFLRCMPKVSAGSSNLARKGQTPCWPLFRLKPRLGSSAQIPDPTSGEQAQGLGPADDPRLSLLLVSSAVTVVVAHPHTPGRRPGPRAVTARPDRRSPLWRAWGLTLSPTPEPPQGHPSPSGALPQLPPPCLKGPPGREAVKSLSVGTARTGAL